MLRATLRRLRIETVKVAPLTAQIDEKIFTGSSGGSSSSGASSSSSSSDGNSSSAKKDREPPKNPRFRFTDSAGSPLFVSCTMFVGAVFVTSIVIGPWFVSSVKEMLGFNLVQEVGMMPLVTKEWWVNQWRKGMTPWRSGETVPDFWVPNFEFAEKETGLPLREGSHSGDKKPKRALVPLCGSTPMVKHLAKMGYEVDAIDCADVAIRMLIEGLESVVTWEEVRRIHLHLGDFFDGAVWSPDKKKLLRNGYDLIYDRQALSAINPADREDYSFLLRSALKKDGGVIVVEGVSRSKRLKNNMQKGPPFNLELRHLEKLFPEKDGFAVKCLEVQDRASVITKEERVLGRVAASKRVTTYPCCIWRPSDPIFNKAKR